MIALALAALVLGLAAGWGLTRLGVLPGPRRRRGYAKAPEGPIAPLGVPVRLDATRDILRAAYRLDEQPEPEDPRRDDQRQLMRALRDIGDLHGARAAVLWAVPPGDPGLPAAIAFSVGEAAPALSASQVELAVWTAREGMLSFDRSEGSPTFAAAPVALTGQAGVLTLHLGAESKVPREALKVWLPRHGQSMAALHELVRTRGEVARSNLKLRATIRSAMTLQGTRDPLELEQVLIRQALEVAGAEWAVLVRWDPAERRGAIQATTLDWDPEDPGDRRVTDASLAGVVSHEGTPLVFPDARHVARDARAVFDGLPLPEGTESLVIVPVRRGKDERPIGVLVCGHSAIGVFGPVDARIAQELGIVASGALDTAWAVSDEREVARTDPLTGLANRRRFEEHYRRAVEWTDRHAGSTLALVLVDVDHFKTVNDTYGHEAGDAVLVAVARALQKDRRALDIVARLGGEELALLLPNTAADGAREVAERVRTRLELMEVPTNAGLIRVTASFGVAVYSARAGDQAQVFERADKALYAAKRNGRNRVEVAADRRSGESGPRRSGETGGRRSGESGPRRSGESGERSSGESERE